MQEVSFARQIAELLRIHLGRHEQIVDDGALRVLSVDSDTRGPLAECLRGVARPRLTDEGARLVGELVAAWEEQT